MKARPGSPEWEDQLSGDLLFVIIVFALIFGIPAAYTYFFG